jgi:hypothetical protein
MRFDENRESEILKMFLDVESYEELEKATVMMTTFGSFSIYTHTSSTNVVDVYIQNRSSNV